MVDARADAGRGRGRLHADADARLARPRLHRAARRAAAGLHPVLRRDGFGRRLVGRRTRPGRARHRPVPGGGGPAESRARQRDGARLHGPAVRRPGRDAHPDRSVATQRPRDPQLCQGRLPRARRGGHARRARAADGARARRLSRRRCRVEVAPHVDLRRERAIEHGSHRLDAKDLEAAALVQRLRRAIAFRHRQLHHAHAVERACMREQGLHESSPGARAPCRFRHHHAEQARLVARALPRFAAQPRRADQRAGGIEGAVHHLGSIGVRAQARLPPGRRQAGALLDRGRERLRVPRVSVEHQRAVGRRIGRNQTANGGSGFRSGHRQTAFPATPPLARSAGGRCRSTRRWPRRPSRRAGAAARPASRARAPPAPTHRATGRRRRAR
eukprot:Opistho-1_new@31108